MGDRGLDQRLRIGAGDQHVGRHVQVERPEFAAAGDVGDRLAGGAALDQRGKGLGVDRAFGVEQQRQPVEPGDVREQDLGVEPVDPGGGAARAAVADANFAFFTASRSAGNLEFMSARRRATRSPALYGNGPV